MIPLVLIKFIVAFSDNLFRKKYFHEILFLLFRQNVNGFLVSMAVKLTLMKQLAENSTLFNCWMVVDGSSIDFQIERREIQ